MIKNILLFAALCLTSGVITATSSIYGIIRDTQGKPIAYANVVLLNAQDSTFIAGAVSLENGTFKMVTASAGEKLLKVSSVGYETTYHNCQEGNNGTVTLRESSRMLGEVIVNLQRPSYRLTPEGMQTQIEGTVLSHMGSGNDVLRYIPGLQKEKEGYVVFGKGKPIIYINGRLMRDDDELDQLKSEDIKSVELITNPGAKYDASVRAVIKIKTRTMNGEGFGFDTRTSYYQYTKGDFVEQLNWNYRHHNLDLFATHYYSSFANNSHGRLITDTYADTLWHIENDMDNKTRWRTISNTAGVNCVLNSDHSMGARYTLKIQPKQHSHVVLNSTVFANGESYDQLKNNIAAEEKRNPSHLLNAYYHGKVSENEIDFNFDWVSNSMNQEQRHDEKSENKESQMVNSTASDKNRMLAAKLTWERPLWNGKLMLGVEHIGTTVHSDYVNEQGLLQNSFSKLKSRQLSAFLQYSTNTKMGQFSLGMRVEHVNFDYYDQGKHVAEQSRTFNNLFPSFTYGKQIGDVQLQLNYAARTHRPSYSQLSNNVIYGNRFTMQSGNPNLKHEIIHNIGVSGSWKFLQCRIEMNDRRHAIILWSEQLKGNQAVSIFKPRNINSLKNINASISAAPTVGLWTPQLSVQVYKQWLTLKTNIRDYKLNQPIVAVQFSNGFQFEHGWTASLALFFSGKGDQENISNIKNMISTDFNITKSFMNNRLTVKVGATDIFKKSVYKPLIHNGLMNSLNINTADSQGVSITVRYRMNMSKIKYKGTGAGNSEKNRLSNLR